MFLEFVIVIKVEMWEIDFEFELNIYCVFLFFGLCF